MLIMVENTEEGPKLLRAHTHNIIRLAARLGNIWMESKLLVCGLWKRRLYMYKRSARRFSVARTNHKCCLPSKALSLHFGYGGGKRERNVEDSGPLLKPAKMLLCLALVLP